MRLGHVKLKIAFSFVITLAFPYIWFVVSCCMEQTMAGHNELGSLGEDRAVAYLERKGYVVLERNWRCGHKEVDIICLKDGLLVMVEVKTRMAPAERPEELLNLRKRRNLRRAADAYVKAKGIRQEVRFDLVVVTGEGLEIEHIEDVIQVFE